MSKETNKKPSISEKKLDEAYDALNVVQWQTMTRKSEARRVLEHLRDPIERARTAGASWPVIAETVAQKTGIKISVPTMRSFFKKEAISEKEEDRLAKKGETTHDFSADQPQTTQG